MSRITTWSCVLSVLFLLAGCVAYGGSGSEEATYQRIERVLERFDEDLSRARGELGALEAASSEGPVLAALAAHYAALVEGHEAVLDDHRQLAAGLSPASSYRTLRHVYGALIAEQAHTRAQYEGLLQYVHHGHSADSTVSVDRGRPYALIPPYYARAANAGRELTVNQVISRVRSAGAPRDGFQLMMPAGPSPEDDGEEDASGPGH